MEHVQLICIFIILISMETLCVSSLSVKTNELSSSLKNCPTIESGKKCIYKCCPRGQYVRQKKCLPHEKAVDFSEVSVYDKELRKTVRNVEDTFTILEGRFLSDPLFRNTSVNRNSVGFVPYVLENGDLQLEKPNVYYRWVDVPNMDFCIDYAVTAKGSLTAEPKFFVVAADGLSVIVSEGTTFLAVARWISCVFLLLLLVVYMLLPELQNLGGLILMNYVGSLFTAFLLLAVIQLSTYSTSDCMVLTLGIYYSFLATFCWMSVMSYDIWWTFRGYAKARQIHRRGERFKLAMYCLYAYGVPLLMTIFLYLVMVVDMKSLPWFIIPDLVNLGCFLEGVPKLLYLYIPMLILIAFNWLFYVMTAFNMYRLIRGTAILNNAAAGSPSAHRYQRNRFMVYLKLSVVMGLSWLFEIISFVHPEYSFMWCISDTYNMLLGLLIFIIFVCKKKIYRKIYKRFALPHTSKFYLGSSKSHSNSSSDTNPESVALRVCSDPKGKNKLYSTPQRTQFENKDINIHATPEKYDLGNHVTNADI